MEKKKKMLTSVLYKTATTLPHYDFVLLSKNILMMWKSPKVEDAYGPCVSLVEIWF